ncbi:MAG: hypothetical protein FWF86_05120 [Clostridia bacterium]|nr:hypothetical protein [Clostridia bacterium]
MLTTTQTFQRSAPLEAGVYTAVCTMVVDLGIQYNKHFDKSTQQVKILWNIIGETVEINGETLPRQVSKDFTMSLDERSTLRKMLQSWRGAAFTAEELQGFDLKKLLGAGCQLQLIHKTNERGTFAVVENIMALPKGSPKPEAESVTFFDMDDAATYEVFASLPRYIQEKAAQAENFAGTGLALPEKNGNGNGNGNGGYQYGDPPPASFVEIESDDELPF